MAALRLLALTAVALLPLLALLSGCARERSVQRILLISIDTCRQDHFGCYGHTGGLTPRIDEFAREAVLFRHANSPIPLTLPAHSSMLCASDPIDHGVHDNLSYRLGEENTTIAEVLRESGFRTGGVVGAVVLDKRFNIDQGFDTWDDDFGRGLAPGSPTPSERRAEEVTRLGMEWLELHRKESFFLLLHYYDPHIAYDPPEPFASKFQDDLYAGEVAYTDHWVGVLLDRVRELGLWESTVIVVTADHGEGLGDHGEPAHDFFIYQSTIAVPLIIKPAGWSEARIAEGVVSIIDIAPTLLAHAGKQAPEGMRGRDLTPAWTGEPAPPEVEPRLVYCESLVPTKYGGAPLFGIVGDRWKYIHTTRPELYDLREDPGEVDNLIDREERRAGYMRGRLEGMLQSRTERLSERTTTDKETRERLQSLGYMSGSAVQESFALDSTRPDPKDLIGFHREFTPALEAIEAGDHATARRVASALAESHPGIPDVHAILGTAAFEEGDYREAVRLYTHALELITARFAGDTGELRLSPNVSQILYNLGNALAETGERDQALRHFEEALTIDPEYLDARFNLAVTLAEAGRVGEATGHLERVLESDSTYVEAHYNLSLAHLERGRTAEAVRHLRAAVRHRPEYGEAHVRLGDILAGQRDFAGAVRAYQEAIRVRPNLAESYYKLPRARMAGGDAAAAVADYRRALEVLPDHPSIATELAWILATHPDDRLRDGEEAVRLALGACEATGFRDLAFLTTLAAAYAEAGRYDAAVETERKALDAARASGQERIGPAIEARIEQYRQHRPTRGRF